MKKLFTILSIICIAFVSCTPEKKAGDDSGNNKGNQDSEQEQGGDVVQITSISVDGPVNIAENAPERLIPISLKPNVSVKDNLTVTCEQAPEGTLESYKLKSDGLSVIPKSVGKATFTLQAKDGPAEDVILVVNVLEREALPVSIAIKKQGTEFDNGTLMLSDNSVYTLSAVITDDKGGKSTDGIIWSVTEGSDVISLDGAKVTAKNQGKAKVKAAVDGHPDLSDEVSIDVATVVSITIDRTAFIDGALWVEPGGTATLTATAKDSRGKVVAVKQKWTMTITAYQWTYTSYDDRVVIKSETEDGSTATCRVAVDGKLNVYDEVTVKSRPVPKSITISNATEGHLVTGSTNTVYIKKNTTVEFTAAVQPAEAAQDLEYTFEGSKGNVTVQMTRNVAGYKVQIIAGANSYSGGKRLLPVFNLHTPDSKVSLRFEIHIGDYDAADVKPGDYVYYNSSTQKFKAVDCGLRYVNEYFGRTTPIAQPSSVSGYTYIGVVGYLIDNTFSDDFMGCSALANVKDGSSATDLYEYRSMRKSDLCGFENNASTHAMVVAKMDKTASVWQSTTELIVNDKDINSGLYQWQFYNFSDKSKAVILGDSSTEKQYGNILINFGFVPYLLLNFYNHHLANYPNNNYLVVPVKNVEDYSSSNPVLSRSSKKCTGWFLPGSFDIEHVDIAAWKSLENSQYSSYTSDRAYWLSVEMEKDKAQYCKVDGTPQTTSKSGSTNYTRAVLYL